MLNKVELNTPLQWEYLSRDLDLPGSVIILLHGFNQNAKWIFDDLSPALPKKGPLLSIQAPFLVPQKKDNKWVHGFAWYFFDTESKTYRYPMNSAISGCKTLIEKLKLQDRQKIIVSYSMGGYLAPFLAQQLTQVQKVITINARLRHEELEGATLSFPLTAINGERDSWVDFEESLKSFKKVAKTQKQFKFIPLKNTNHFINDAILDQLKLELKT